MATLHVSAADKMVFRIAEIEVYPENLEAYITAAKAIGAESVAKEPGVVCIFPMQKKEHPTQIRIVEIYRDEAAYKAHLETPHFKTYKDVTYHWVKSLNLEPMQPLDPEHMNLIFRKENPPRKADTIYQFTVKGREGEDVSLADYKGKVLLVVNTATRCGFTPQYEGLEWMYEQHKDKGFEILDFPCNQFGQQAPGTDDEINTFCVVHYKTAFPRFAKVDVNGENAAPLFRFLTDSAKFEGFPQDGKLAPILEKMLREADPDYAKKPDVKWNFTKFLIGRDGKVIRRFEPTAPLSAIEAEIEKALRQSL